MPGSEDEKDEQQNAKPQSADSPTAPNGSTSRSSSSEETQSRIDSVTLRSLSQRYDLLNEVGRGGMGVVYRARDRETGGVVALKVLLPEISGRSELIERFKAEMLLARKVTHKNVCRTHELLRFDDTVVISMEYVEGESLRAFLKRYGSVPLRKGLEWTKQICSALSEAHGQSVVHRDLKPENILIATDGTVKVMDFGLARSVEAQTTQSGTVMGTPAYMSPEQAQGKPVDLRSDIYSLGLILYEMFTGSPAFTADTVSALLYKHVHEMPAPPRQVDPDLPERIESAIQKCLEKNPKKRPQSAAEVEKLLSEKLATTVGAEGEVSEMPLPLHLTRWQHGDYYLSAVALLVAVGFIFFFDPVYPYPALELRTSRQDATQRAVELLLKFEPLAQPEDVRLTFPNGILVFYYPKVHSSGMLKTNQWFREANNGWVIDLDVGQKKPGATSQGTASVSLDSDGKLESLRLPRKSAAIGDKPPAQEAVLGAAINYVREFFGADVGQIVPAASVGKYRQGIYKDELELTWKLQGPEPDIEQVYELAFDPEGLRGALHYRYSKRDSEALESDVWSPFSHGFQERESALKRFEAAGALGLTLLALLVFVLFFARRLYQRTRHSALFTACWVVLAGFGLILPSLLQAPSDFWEFAWIWIPMGSVVGFFFAYAFICVAEHYLERTLPSRANSWMKFLRKPLESRASGLALLRGCMLGALYLGVHTALLAGMILGRLGAPSLGWLAPAKVNFPNLALYSSCLAILATVGASWCLIAFPAALAYRIKPRSSLLMIVPTVLWLATSFSLPGASGFPLIHLFLFAGLQGLFFSAILCRYDFLAMVVAVFTVETWLLVYPVYCILHKVETLSCSLALLPWFVVLLVGLAIYFRPLLVSAHQRVVAVFE